MAAAPEPPPHDHEPQDAAIQHAPHEATKRTFWKRLTSRRFLFVSIVAHIIFGLGAAVWVVQTTTPKRKLTFASAPPAPNPSTRATEHQVQMAKKQQTMSAPAMPKRIVSTGLSKVALPEMPALPTMNSPAVPTRMAGAGGVGFGSNIGGMGAGGPAGGGGAMPLFGLHQGAGLAGVFYDLKQEKDGKPTDMALQPFEQGNKFDINAPVNKTYDRTLTAFVSGSMGATLLDKYFRASQPLYLTQFYIPAISANEAPKAFSLGDQVKGRRWIVVYRGKVTAPESGRYKFAGFGDDILVVRLDGRVVLDASFAPPTKNRPPPYGKTILGETVDIRGGLSYTMEVLIGERPGGEYVGYLLLDKEGSPSDKQPNGEPLLPIFKLAPSDTPQRGKVAPAVAADTAWSVWKGEPQRSASGVF